LAPDQVSSWRMTLEADQTSTDYPHGTGHPSVGYLSILTLENNTLIRLSSQGIHMMINVYLQRFHVLREILSIPPSQPSYLCVMMT